MRFNLMSCYVFLVTVPNVEEGKKIAYELIKKKIVACVNIVHDITSIYRWKDVIEEEKEYLLIIKTNENNSEKLIQNIIELHSYETPECIGFKIEKGSKNYLDWIKEVVEP